MPRNYFALAVDLARSRAARETPFLETGRQDSGFSVVPETSHWNWADGSQTDRYGYVLAACGRRVKEDLISGNPTCEKCAAAAAQYNALEF